MKRYWTGIITSACIFLILLALAGSIANYYFPTQEAFAEWFRPWSWILLAPMGLFIFSLIVRTVVRVKNHKTSKR